MATKQTKHKHGVGEELKIVKDLSGKEPEMVGRDARVQELLPADGRYPQYR